MRAAAAVTTIFLASTGVAAACDPGDQSCAAPRAIRVGAATYGGTCGVSYGNATQSLAAACNGRARCDYTIDFRRIGDPAAGCRKDFTAYWDCGDGSVPRFVRVPPEAGFDKTVLLQCADLAPTAGANALSPPAGSSGGDAASRTTAVRVCSGAIAEMRLGEFKRCQDSKKPNCKEPGKMAVGQPNVRGGEDFYSITLPFKADGMSFDAQCTIDRGHSAGIGISEVVAK